MNALSEAETDYDRVQLLCSILIDRATGGREDDDNGYYQLRSYVLARPSLKERAPAWLPRLRTLNQFWGFIKPKFDTYAERRDFLWQEFDALVSFCELGVGPSKIHTDEALQVLDSEHVQACWQRALDRIEQDPEGAITLAKSLIESACKIILDKRNVEYGKNEDINSLYKKVADLMLLSPASHEAKALKQILGGCNSIVGGLGCLRNAMGDAHGKGMKPIRPTARHARLAVNIAGAMASFLAETYQKNFR